jgi:hypothetical protein
MIQISRNITRNIVEPWLGSLWQQKNVNLINFYYNLIIRLKLLGAELKPLLIIEVLVILYPHWL